MISSTLVLEKQPQSTGSVAPLVYLLIRLRNENYPNSLHRFPSTIPATAPSSPTLLMISRSSMAHSLIALSLSYADPIPADFTTGRAQPRPAQCVPGYRYLPLQSLISFSDVVYDLQRPASIREPCLASHVRTVLPTALFSVSIFSQASQRSVTRGQRR